MRERLKNLRDLFLTFAKMGAITFGGGMAMLPILQREIVYLRHWATEEELIDYYAIGQCTPGIIAINTSTFIGQKQGGILGGVAATLGMVFPSLVIISVIAGLVSNFADLPVVRNAFAGIQVCVCVLIFNATLKLLKKSVIDYRTALIFALVLAGSVVLNLSPVWFVLVSAGVGVGLKALEVRKAVKATGAGADADADKATDTGADAGAVRDTDTGADVGAVKDTDTGATTDTGAVKDTDTDADANTETERDGQ